jgi:hypothetical protein
VTIASHRTVADFTFRRCTARTTCPKRKVSASCSGKYWLLWDDDFECVDFIIVSTGFMILTGAQQACAMTALNLVSADEIRNLGVAGFSSVVGLIGASAGPGSVLSQGI